MDNTIFDSNIVYMIEFNTNLYRSRTFVLFYKLVYY